MHNDVARPLEVGETPLQSIYDDWETFTDKYPNVKPKVNDNVEVYRKPNEDCSSGSETVKSAKSSLKQRREMKANKAHENGVCQAI